MSSLPTQMQAISLNDAAYPQALREISGAPEVLYLRGQAELLHAEPKIALIGSRNPSSYGQKVAAELATALAKIGVCIVSGLARGIDGICHRAALEAGGKTIGVLGTAIDQLYPTSNQPLANQMVQQALIVSEYAPGTEFRNWQFSARNRIISGLSRAVIVVEAAAKSGTLITVQHALKQGREVFAVPGPVDSSSSAGTLQLLREGARCVRHVQDVVEDLDLNYLVEHEENNLTIHKINSINDPLLAWFGTKPVHIDSLLEKTGLHASELGALLIERELNGQIRQLPGHYYVRI